MGDRVRHEQVHERRPVGSRGPLEGGRDPVLEAERPVGDARDVRPGSGEGEAEERARRGAERDQSHGDRRRRRADQALGQERHDRGHRPVERPLEPVELEAAPAHLSRDSPDQTVETGGVDHARP